MSKKNKRKFYNSPSSQPAGNISSSAVSNSEFIAYSGGTPSKAVMGDVHAAEYRVIKHDLFKVVILNVVFLVAVLTLYYTNLHSQYLERWFGHILHF